MSTAEDKPQHSLADYMVTALSPLLIMVLIGSLVFFLLEVLYTGEYSGRMQWTLFFFVFGSVLIGRVAMAPGISGRAGLYSLVLGFLTWVSLQAFVEYPKDQPVSHFSWLINLGLVVLIWWSAQRLTWDCTYIDDAIDASGAGVLESAGLERGAEPEPPAAPVEESKKEKKKNRREPPAFIAWVERYQKFMMERKTKPHTPGVWVVYFSLAALPLFGVGQAFIPPEEAERRRFVFWLMISYTGSGLGLLLTTCFLGLRRYLRQRGLQMPLTMTGVWLTVGGLLIAVLLGLGALLPRPEPEYTPLGQLSRLGSPERGASKVSVLRDKPGDKGEGMTPGQGKPANQGEPKDAQGGDRGGGQGKSGGKQQGQPNDKNGQQGKSDGDKGSGGNARGDRNEKSSGGSSSSSSGSSGGEKSSSDKSSADKSSSDRNNSQQQRSGNERSGNGQQQQQKGQQASQEKRGENQGGEQSSGSSSSPPSSNPVSSVASALESLSVVLKWVVIAVIVILIGIAIGRAVLEFLANFTGWADRLLKAFRAWWQGLFGWFNRAKGEGDASEAPVVVEKPLPFLDYRNPFQDGSAGHRPPGELVRYTFDAFQAWAYELDLGRQPGETALEFTGRVSNEVPALDTHGRRLANLYVRAAYARGALPQDCLDILEQFWEQLEAAVERPLSA